jgi:hypothetical protein
MNELTISLIVVVCVFVSALLGFYLRKALPEHHLSNCRGCCIAEKLKRVLQK